MLAVSSPTLGLACIGLHRLASACIGRSLRAPKDAIKLIFIFAWLLAIAVERANSNNTRRLAPRPNKFAEWPTGDENHEQAFRFELRKPFCGSANPTERLQYAKRARRAESIAALGSARLDSTRLSLASGCESGGSDRAEACITLAHSHISCSYHIMPFGVNEPVGRFAGGRTVGCGGNAISNAISLSISISISISIDIDIDIAIATATAIDESQSRVGGQKWPNSRARRTNNPISS